jgi:peroxiredoxin
LNPLNNNLKELFMTKFFSRFLTAVLAVFLLAGPASAAPEIGKPAPEITATDIKGNPFKLSDHKGQPVVLEWTNHECPFVVKHYSSSNMQKLQKSAQEMGVKWVSIVSSAPGKQGHGTAEQAQKILDDAGASVTAKLLDESGEIGKLYDAQTTPHMFVIDANGVLAYAGAIDDNSSADPKTVEGAKNYVLAALESLKAGKPVETAQTQPYGCGVKYGR